ncbi:dimethylallyl tryptophan synthase [Aspergillus saccharolyticus JOP 1030-1]|uniref:Dimethylallyl tryptophan synthase n=1 Tax=Aspergillus saccharolyticus JOP 1030-1 TaxID=1450539 RepID=A0A319AD37_9EURO|nr:dimethylallyl tryptophan synthase [Aspergillus saccharolyticus JOP 1030-1]PYH49498.1 dimethylallyl tryptophan synthase [Aspergillus saccharolyticus JOP 1030-1]
MEIPQHAPTQLPKPFYVLSQALNLSNEHHAKWWYSTAPMFAAMLAGADYDVHAQYKFLCLHREVIIPALGPYPETGQAMHWKSHLTRYGLPFELSFNYSNSRLRFAFEPLGPLTGTPEDPFNTRAIRPVLHDLQAMVPGLDLAWFEHFTQALVVSDEDAHTLLEKAHHQDHPIPVFKTQNKLAADLEPSGALVLKTYIYPRIKSLATGTPKETLMFDAITAADTEGRVSTPLAILKEFVAERAPTLLGHFLSCDLVQPADSRIKVYFMERQLSLASLEGIWTLNGRRNDPETLEGLDALRELWHLLPVTEGLCPLPDCFYEPGTSPQEQLPFIINFTLLPKSPLPEPQIYFPAFGHNDRAVAQGLATFFHRRGWGGMAQSYVSDLASYYPEVDWDTATHLQAWISFSYKRRKPYLSVYLHTFEALRAAAQEARTWREGQND